MSLGCKEKLAVDKLLREDEICNFEETLDDFFECWLCSDLTDGTDSEMRAVRFHHLTQIKRFFKEVS